MAPRAEADNAPQEGADVLGTLPAPPDGGNSNYTQFRKHLRGPISSMHEVFCDKKIEYATVEGEAISLQPLGTCAIPGAAAAAVAAVP